VKAVCLVAADGCGCRFAGVRQRAGLELKRQAVKTQPTVTVNQSMRPESLRRGLSTRGDSKKGSRRVAGTFGGQKLRGRRSGRTARQPRGTRKTDAICRASPILTRKDATAAVEEIPELGERGRRISRPDDR